VTLGFLLGLGAVGCTKHNPAFHKPADGGVSPPQDVAAADTPISADRPDTPVTPKDAELRPDTPLARETGADSPKLVDSHDEVGSGLPDALGPDGREDAGADTRPTKDTGLDTVVPDGAIGPSFDVPPISPDVEHPDVPVLPQDAADAPQGNDAPEGIEVGELVPDAEGPDAGPDAEPDSEPLTDV
jgi:hypothetical protein